LALLEEAVIDGIPAIAIDPKGDLGNLLLSFPNLQPGDFRPWVDPAQATRQGLTVDQFAGKQAERWRQGLAEWDQEPARISRYRDAVEIRPRKSDIAVGEVALVWTPWQVDAQGLTAQAW
jgi:hypothetical protein